MFGVPMITLCHKMRRITPSDTEDLKDYDGSPAAMLLYCEGGGSIRFTPNGGPESEVITLNMSARSYIPVAARKVWATGTSASPIYGCWVGRDKLGAAPT